MCMRLHTAGLGLAAIKQQVLQQRLPEYSSLRMHAVQDLFQAHVDVDALCAAINAPRPTELTPKGFQHRISRLCLAQPQTIVLPEATDQRVLKAGTLLPALLCVCTCTHTLGHVC